MKETRIWCKIIFQIDVQQIQSNERNFLYIYLFGDLVERNFQRNFHMAQHLRNPFKHFSNYTL
jgi:hypothetical protein